MDYSRFLLRSCPTALASRRYRYASCAAPAMGYHFSVAQALRPYLAPLRNSQGGAAAREAALLAVGGRAWLEEAKPCLVFAGVLVVPNGRFVI